MGAYAEYLRVKQDGVIAPTPASMTDGESAAFPYGALTAVALLRGVEMKNRSVLILGASGSDRVVRGPAREALRAPR